MAKQALTRGAAGKALFPPNRWGSGGLWIVLSIGALLCACTSEPKARVPSQTEAAIPPPPQKPQDEPRFAEPRPEVLNRDELTAVFSSDGVELDFRKSYLATEAQLFTALYEGLFSYHPFTMEPVPALAEDWHISEDKKTWTFTLRKTGRYWNGDPVRSADFRSAWISLLDPDTQSPYSSLFDLIAGAREYRMGLAKDPRKVGIESPDPHTLVVKLNSPASFFPAMLCHHSFSPIHPSMTHTKDWSKAPPLSNGPFYIVENQKDALILAKNSYYWDASQVALNKLIFRYTQDQDASTAYWNSGEARWISGDINFKTLTDLSGVMVNALFATHYYFIRSAKAPWNDHRVRRALSLALPWTQIREGYLAAKTLIYPLPGYPPVNGLESANVEQAQKLLAEAGYPRGAGIPELVIRLTPSPEAARIGGLMAAAWMRHLGIQTRIEVVPYGQYFQSLKQNDYEVGSSTWIGDFADPYTFLQMWRRDSNLNAAQLNDRDYEALMDRSMTEEGEQRWQTLAEAETLLLDRGSVLPISFGSAVNIVDTGELNGWFPNALDIHPVKYLAFKTAFRPLPGVVLLEAEP